MSGFKHTPAPWWASGLEVGTVPMMDVKIANVSGATYEEAKANACLIAAAPGLLELVAALLPYAEAQIQANLAAGGVGMAAELELLRAARTQVEALQ